MHGAKASLVACENFIKHKLCLFVASWLWWPVKILSRCHFYDTTLHASSESILDLTKKLEHGSLLAIIWFENNYMKLNEEKCHLILTRFTDERHMRTNEISVGLYIKSICRLSNSMHMYV